MTKYIVSSFWLVMLLFRNPIGRSEEFQPGGKVQDLQKEGSLHEVH